MASLNVSYEYKNEGPVITAYIEGADVPSHIFLYENTGSSTLGAYQGVANLSQINKFPLWEGKQIPVFGNKYVRHSEAKIIVTNGQDPQLVINGLLASVQSFVNSYRNQSSTTQVYTL